MIQKLALLVGGLGAAAVLAFALGLTNFIFAAPGTTKQTADIQPAAQVADSGAAAGNRSDVGNGQPGQSANPQTKKVIDKVYIAPTPPPKTIHVGPSATPQPQQPTNNTTPTQPPSTSTTWHDDGGQGHDSEHSGGHNGHGDD